MFQKWVAQSGRATFVLELLRFIIVLCANFKCLYDPERDETNSIVVLPGRECAAYVTAFRNRSIQSHDSIQIYLAGERAGFAAVRSAFGAGRRVRSETSAAHRRNLRHTSRACETIEIGAEESCLN
jgi:hypothetical protein